MYAWPRQCKGPAYVAEVFKEQFESNNTKPFKIEARCVECFDSCVAVKANMTLTSNKWIGPRPGYKSVCYGGTIDLFIKTER